MSRLKIAVDIDGVLARFNEGFIDHFNSTRLNGFMTMPEITEYNMQASYGVDEREMINCFHSFTDKNAWEELDVYTGWLRAVKLLSGMEDELIIVTARAVNKHDNLLMKREIRRQTYKWLNEKIDLGMFSGVHFVRDKINLCDKLGVDFLIDDAPRYAELAKELNAKVKVLCAMQPWNAQIEKRYTPSTALEAMGIDLSVETIDREETEKIHTRRHSGGINCS